MGTGSSRSGRDIMQSLDEFLAQHEHPTVELLASYIRSHVVEQWQQVLRSNQDALLGLFDKSGEGAAYGTYAQRLFRPIQDQLSHNGIVASPAFPGTLATSREWGPPRARERWMWSMVKRDQGEILGTLVVCLFHDHTRFCIPRVPGVLALQESRSDKIVWAVSRASGNPESDAT